MNNWTRKGRFFHLFHTFYPPPLAPKNHSSDKTLKELRGKKCQMIREGNDFLGKYIPLSGIREG